MPTRTDKKKAVPIDLSAAAEALDRLPPLDRVRSSMEMAVFFLEYAAYEMALDQNAEEVSEIILMAAKLDQAAQRLDERALMRVSALKMRKM
ncbi:MAG: hypothetical protein AB8B58_14300 [Roseobacter sp.]